MLDGNSAALRKYEREQDENERNYDPEEQAMELQRNLTYAQLIEIIQEASHLQATALLENVRLGQNMDLAAAGMILGDLIEEWARGVANEP